MEKVEEHPTHRIVSFVDRRLAEHIEQMARVNDRSVSAEVRRILRAVYLVDEKR